VALTTSQLAERADPPVTGGAADSGPPVTGGVADSLLSAAKGTLEMIAAGANIREVLASLCAAIDAQDDAMMSTILLADSDGQRLWPAAGPRVPAGWTEAITPLVIARDAGSCGAAAFLRERVIISDIVHDPRWSDVLPLQSRTVALAHGLRASWSEPLISQSGELLGTFAMYYPTRRTPSARELQLIEDAGRIATIAIESDRARAALKRAVLEVQASADRLRRDEQELRQITDAIPQTIIVLKPDGAVVYANQAILEFTGMTMEEVLAPGFRARLFHPEDVARVADGRRAGLAGNLPFENEQRARRHDGQYRWFLIRYNPLRDERGAVIRWYATGTDIDDRKRAEERILSENIVLREDADRASMFEEIVGSSAPLRRVLSQVARVAPTDSTVLITGETGTGKELVARAIHKRSSRASHAFIRVNCAAIPTSLIASELFGHEKGAFTGALQRRLGRFEAADRGTLFLDEIGDLPTEAQTALLRVLQEHEVERVGSNHPISVDVRVIAATNQDLDDAVASGTFRQDLYYRLDVFPIEVPPLRQRADDVPMLVAYLVERYAKKAGKRVRHIEKATIRRLQAYDWPGNVRELQNVIERAVVLCETDTFSVDESWLVRKPVRLATPGAPLRGTLVEREKEIIEAALADSHGRVSGPSGAAARLGIPRQTLDSKIRTLRIDKYRFRAS
jgi:formate hydrogenlyase transcriptional activator